MTVFQSLIKCGLLEIGTNNTFSNLVQLAAMTLKASNKIFQRSETNRSCFCCTPPFVTFQEYFRPRKFTSFNLWVLFYQHSLSPCVYIYYFNHLVTSVFLSDPFVFFIRASNVNIYKQVLAGIELIFFQVNGTALCFGTRSHFKQLKQINTTYYIHEGLDWHFNPFT